MKLNNKGFTLVEVLAVVVILSIIIAIMVPNVNYLIDKQKEETLNSINESINSATNIYISDNKDDIDVNGICNESTSTLLVSKDGEIIDSKISVAKLIELGYLKRPTGGIKNPKDNSILNEENTKISIYYDCSKKNLVSDWNGAFDSLSPIIVYTVNVGTIININSEIPKSITTYTTASDARSNFSNRPFYLRHVLKKGIVKESYTEFVITPEMASANPGLKAGTYSLRGGVDESTLTTKTVFNNNMSVLKQAFGENSEYCTISTDNMMCTISELRINTNSYGAVNVRNDSSRCLVSINEEAICTE